MTTVVGIAFAGKVLRKPNSNESSMKLGYGTPNWRANTSALAKLSRVRMPINCTSEYFFDSAELKDNASTQASTSSFSSAEPKDDGISLMNKVKKTTRSKK